MIEERSEAKSPKTRDRQIRYAHEEADEDGVKEWEESIGLSRRHLNKKLFAEDLQRGKSTSTFAGISRSS